MKKLNGKQKLIGSIAIVLVAVILAIVITVNVASNNSQIADEGYAATSANAGSSLIANYILNGITIGGITGKMDILNTNDATATAEDIEWGKVAYARGERIVGTMNPPPIEELKGNIAYADFEGDGTADGIIFADLKVGNRGDGNWEDSWGDYTIPTEEGLKEYYVVNESYTEAKFGGLTGELIAPVEGTSGKDRFYVMALEDFNPGTGYCWYDAAYGNLDSQYNVSSTANDFAVAGAEPTGKTNTERMIASWNSSEYGAQNDNGTYEDMWGAIQDEVADGWFVPSKSEWSAFGGEVLELNNITSSNYDDYGLSSWCWSSSQRNTDSAYCANIVHGYIGTNGYVNNDSSVRLATTF